ncbi:MAG: hypothetical protein WD049_01005 [Candidatus Paceibacterota bacterium]
MTQRHAALNPRLVVLLLLAVGLLGSVAEAQVRVRGYTRKDGTYVKPHFRSRPDGNFENNWSRAGNRNPYTGKIGTKTRPPTRASKGFPTRRSTTIVWTGIAGTSTRRSTPFLPPGRSDEGTSEFSTKAVQSGSRVMTNPFVVEQEVAPFESELDALKQILAHVDVLARDPSIPRWYRSVTAIQVLSGLDLERLPQTIQTQLQPRFNAINSILAEYSFTNGSDFRQLADRDAQRILKQLRDIAAIDLPVNRDTH